MKREEQKNLARYLMMRSESEKKFLKSMEKAGADDFELYPILHHQVNTTLAASVVILTM